MRVEVFCICVHITTSEYLFAELNGLIFDRTVTTCKHAPDFKLDLPLVYVAVVIFFSRTKHSVLLLLLPSHVKLDLFLLFFSMNVIDMAITVNDLA